MPPGIAGGLRYHGDSQLVSQLYHEKRIEAVAVPQTRHLRGRRAVRALRGIVPAPGPATRSRAAIDEALKCKAHRQAGDPLQASPATVISTWLPPTATLPARLKTSPTRRGDRRLAGTFAKVLIRARYRLPARSCQPGVLCLGPGLSRRAREPDAIRLGQQVAADRLIVLSRRAAATKGGRGGESRWSKVPGLERAGGGGC